MTRGAGDFLRMILFLPRDAIALVGTILQVRASLRRKLGKQRAVKRIGRGSLPRDNGAQRLPIYLRTPQQTVESARCRAHGLGCEVAEPWRRR